MKEKLWRSNEVREMLCERLQRDTKNTKQSLWLLMSISVTVVSKEEDELLSAVAGNQTNIDYEL